MIYPIRLFGDPVLRKVARPVTVFDEALKQMSTDMIETMYDSNGVGLAAPQIGISKRIFVGLELGEQDVADDAEDVDINSLSTEEKRQRWNVIAEHVIINPEITQKAGVQYGQEGCLSVPGLFADEVKREDVVTIHYQDVEGKSQEYQTEGHFARVIQHELDHLNGVMFMDRLSPDEKQNFMQSHRSELAQMQRDAKVLIKQLKDDPMLSSVA